MEFSVKVTVGVFLLFSVASGQIMPGVKPVCTGNVFESGINIHSHESYCELFYVCGAGGFVNTMNCPVGLLFSTVNACTYPGDAISANCPCNSSYTNRNYKSVCHERYFHCNGDMLVAMNCTAGHFNVTNGQCEEGVGVDDEHCVRPSGTAGNGSCINKKHYFGDDCQFTAMMDNNTVKHMQCAQGTAFNESTCICSIRDDTCPKSNNKNRNKLNDPMCRDTCVVRFDKFKNQTESLQAYSNKLAANIDDFFKASDVAFTSGIATFGSGSYLYYYASNNNEATPSFGARATLKSDAPTIAPIVVFANVYLENCSPTFSVTATLAGTTYTVNVTVTTMTRYSMKNTTYISATHTSSISVAAGNYVGIDVLFSGVIRLGLVDKGPDGKANNQPTITNGTTPLGKTVQPNNCGTMIGYGLIGSMFGFSFNEGCAGIDAFFTG